MSLTKEEVEHIANLARLELSEDEKARYREQLSAILDYAARLQALDTSAILPTASVLTQPGALRKDEPGACFGEGELFANAPQAKGKQFRVPPVME